MNGAKQWVILFFFLLVSLTEVAFAEGNCPPGYYPIGGQGVQGCALFRVVAQHPHPQKFS